MVLEKSRQKKSGLYDIQYERADNGRYKRPRDVRMISIICVKEVSTKLAQDYIFEASSSSSTRATGRADGKKTKTRLASSFVMQSESGS